MDRQQAHNLIDKIFDQAEVSGAVPESVPEVPEQPTRELPKDKRVVRTKVSGDRVYLLDEIKKTRQWVTNPDVLDSLGFTLNDVGEVEDDDLLKYQMSSALYRRVDEQ